MVRLGQVSLARIVKISELTLVQMSLVEVVLVELSWNHKLCLASAHGLGNPGILCSLSLLQAVPVGSD